MRLAPNVPRCWSAPASHAANTCGDCERRASGQLAATTIVTRVPLKFSASSQTTLNAQGEYVSGSRLEQVVIRQATVGVTVNSSSFFGSNLSLLSNGIGLRLSGSSSVIQNSLFEGNDFGVQHSGSAHRLRNNVFRKNGEGIAPIKNVGTSAIQITGNSFVENTNAITSDNGGLSGWNISSNTFVRNQRVLYGRSINDSGLVNTDDLRIEGGSFSLTGNIFTDNGAVIVCRDFKSFGPTKMPSQPGSE